MEVGGSGIGIKRYLNVAILIIHGKELLHCAHRLSKHY